MTDSKRIAIRPFWFWALASIIVIGVLDFSLGYEFSSFLFYFLPIGMIGWLYGLWPSISCAILSSIVWLMADTLSGHPYTNSIAPAWNAFIRLLSFLFAGWTMASISGRLHKAEAEVKALEGILPICAQCKKIRDEDGHWLIVEEYIEKHTKARLTHGYCTDCGNMILADAGLTPNLK